ncbi:hypothetical protein HG530_012109 [Fusarium avenaceum]|nr:hypothetical protein HG530_012109 [Fusarium avenaceum]
MPSLENIETPKPVDGLTKGFSRDAGAGFILGGLGGVIAFSKNRRSLAPAEGGCRDLGCSSLDLGSLLGILCRVVEIITVSTRVGHLVLEGFDEPVKAHGYQRTNKGANPVDPVFRVKGTSNDTGTKASSGVERTSSELDTNHLSDEQGQTNTDRSDELRRASMNTPWTRDAPPPRVVRTLNVSGNSNSDSRVKEATTNTEEYPDVDHERETKDDGDVEELGNIEATSGLSSGSPVVGLGLDVGNLCASKSEEEEHGGSDKLSNTGNEMVLEV